MDHEMIAYHDRFPDFQDPMAIEVRSGSPVLFPGTFLFLEHYCSNPACDCRRVRIVVAERRDPSKPLATMDWGFETSDYYRQWTVDEESAEWLVVGVLDPDSPQSDHAPTFLDYLRHIVTAGDNTWDAEVRERYFRFKASLGGTPIGGLPEASCLQGMRFQGGATNEE